MACAQGDFAIEESDPRDVGPGPLSWRPLHVNITTINDLPELRGSFSANVVREFIF